MLQVSIFARRTTVRQLESNFRNFPDALRKSSQAGYSPVNSETKDLKRQTRRIP